MGLDGEVLDAGVIREDERHGGPQAPLPPLLLEQVCDGAGTGRFARECHVDGGGQGRRAVVVEQIEEATQLRDAGIAMPGPLIKEAIEAGYRLAQALARGDRARRVLGGHEGGDMRRVFHDDAGVVAADVAGHLRRAVHDPHGGRVREQGDRSTHQRVGHRVAIAIEADIRLLA